MPTKRYIQLALPGDGECLDCDLDGATADILKHPIELTLWTPGHWLEKAELLRTDHGDILVVIQESQTTKYGVDCGTGTFVCAHLSRGGWVIEFMNSSLHLVIRTLMLFSAMLPLYSRADESAWLKDPYGVLDPMNGATSRVETMIADTDPRALDGRWSYFITSIGYGAFSEAAIVDEADDYFNL